jgi:hypothetical protein
MVKKKLTKYFVITFVVLVFFSCSDRKTADNPMLHDDSSLFLETLEINDVKFVKQSIYSDTLDSKKVLLIKSDTISYFTNELFVSDSIYDINEDGMDDFSTMYQTTGGFVTYAYLFNRENNSLKITPSTFNNFVPINSESFFQISKDFLRWEFKKYHWLEMESVYIGSYFVDLENGKDYIIVDQGDTLNLNEKKISEVERRVINNYLTNQVSSL